MREHIGATWKIQLNRPFAAAMLDPEAVAESIDGWLKGF